MIQDSYEQKRRTIGYKRRGVGRRAGLALSIASGTAGSCACRQDGGTASALYAMHRLSFDHDHVLLDLREHFDAVLTELEAVAGWETARIKRPVLILGSLDGVETGIRQLRRARPLETTVMRLGKHDVVLPTLPEVLRIKAFLCLERNATRDYLDLAALTAHMGIETAGEAL
ncbi:hypothetical protein [Candidatus Methylospira mobilis]|uniref:hypothetical protein n=1 Tax=Candidatus Methylospira mobilis TaxID=1808979 RepID=UPI001884E895|nr:hypothetical protein [Candidatus Methylospira mobilis]